MHLVCRMLLSSESEEEYETKLEERKKIWSPAFTDYFEKNIEKDMDTLYY